QREQASLEPEASPAEDGTCRPGARLLHPGDVCAGHRVPLAGGAGGGGGGAGGLAALAPPAVPTEPRQSHHLCPGLVRNLSCRGILPPAGGETARTASGDWEAPGG